MGVSFFELLDADISDVFMTDFAVDAIFKSGTVIKPIKVQFFTEALDKTETLYDHAWAKMSDIPYVKANDTLEIGGTVYGIVDSSPDEQGIAINLFLNKV